MIKCPDLLLRLDVGTQVGQVSVEVAVRQERVPDRREGAGLLGAKRARRDHIQGAARLVLVLVMPVRVVPAAAVGDFLGAEPEEEEIVFTRLGGHFDRGAVAGADRERAVHHEFHVARATRLVAGGGDLFRDVAGGNQPLGQGDIVLGEEINLELRAGRGIGIDHRADIVDQLDDQLGQRIGRRRLAREEEGPRRHVQLGIVAQSIIENDYMQNI